MSSRPVISIRARKRGHDQVLDRVDTEHLQGVELLADLAGAEVGGDRGAGDAGDDDGGFFVLASIRVVARSVTAVVVVAGVAGTAITADLGARKIREELDALQVLGVDPIKNLVVPRFLALMLITGLLDIYALVFGISGGIITELLYKAAARRLLRHPLLQRLDHRPLGLGEERLAALGSRCPGSPRRWRRTCPRCARGNLRLHLRPAADGRRRTRRDRQGRRRGERRGGEGPRRDLRPQRARRRQGRDRRPGQGHARREGRRLRRLAPRTSPGSPASSTAPRSCWAQVFGDAGVHARARSGSRCCRWTPRSRSSSSSRSGRPDDVDGPLTVDRADAACHDLLVRLAGRLPDRLLWRLREWLATGGHTAVAATAPPGAAAPPGRADRRRARPAGGRRRRARGVATGA